MYTVRQFWLAAVPVVLLTAACDRSPSTEPASRSATLTDSKASPPLPAEGTQTVIASGLINPRGLAFGPDRAIYVAEAGLGGTTTTVGMCQQGGNGVFTSGKTSRISRVTLGGSRTTVVDGLPSSNSPEGQQLGTAAVAFLGHTLYALLDAGCGHGVPDVPASVIRVRDHGAWSIVANLSRWVKQHPVAHPEAEDFEPDGDWYSMIASDGGFYAVEANGGQVVRVDRNGQIRRVVDISARLGHVVPTAITEGKRDELLVGNLTTFPVRNGAAKIFRVGEHGGLTIAAEGFTTVLGVARDERGRLYVLESFTCPTSAPCFPGPAAVGTGRILRVEKNGSRSVLTSGLTFPTAMIFGPDGALYVSNIGYGAPPGAGQIVRVQVNGTRDKDDH